MKKILILFIGIILLSGCTKKGSYSEKDQYTLGDRSKIINFRGHKLLKVYRVGDGIEDGPVIYAHSVDCNCGQVTSVDSAIFYQYVQDY